jgi:hypothetical protein
MNPPIEKPSNRNDNDETLPRYSGDKNKYGIPNE